MDILETLQNRAIVASCATAMAVLAIAQQDSAWAAKEIRKVSINYINIFKLEFYNGNGFEQITKEVGSLLQVLSAKDARPIITEIQNWRTVNHVCVIRSDLYRKNAITVPDSVCVKKDLRGVLATSAR